MGGSCLNTGELEWPVRLGIACFQDALDYYSSHAVLQGTQLVNTFMFRQYLALVLKKKKKKGGGGGAFLFSSSRLLLHQFMSSCCPCIRFSLTVLHVSMFATTFSGTQRSRTSVLATCCSTDVSSESPTGQDSRLYRPLPRSPIEIIRVLPGLERYHWTQFLAFRFLRELALHA